VRVVDQKTINSDVPPRWLFLLRISLAATVVALIAGSLLPGTLKNVTHTEGTPHRFVHMLAFAVAGGLNRLLTRSWLRPALLIALGLALEVAQHLFYGSPFEWRDVRDNAAGVGSGLLFIALLLNRRFQKTEQEQGR
jgi:hypothetical protein